MTETIQDTTVLVQLRVMELATVIEVQGLRAPIYRYDIPQAVAVTAAGAQLLMGQLGEIAAELGAAEADLDIEVAASSPLVTEEICRLISSGVAEESPQELEPEPAAEGAAEEAPGDPEPEAPIEPQPAALIEPEPEAPSEPQLEAPIEPQPEAPSEPGPALLRRPSEPSRRHHPTRRRAATPRGRASGASTRRRSPQRRARKQQLKEWVLTLATPAVAAGLGILLLSIGVGAWALTRTSTEITDYAQNPPANTSAEAPPEDSTVAAAPVAAAPAPAPEHAQVGALEFELPATAMVEQTGAQEATIRGADEAFRIYLADEPAPAEGEDLGGAIAAAIAADPALTAVPGEAVTDKPGAIEYVEHPEDGSTVLWVTWPEQQHIVAVGCHSKAFVTAQHRSECASFVRSVRVAPEK